MDSRSLFVTVRPWGPSFVRPRVGGDWPHLQAQASGVRRVALAPKRAAAGRAWLLRQTPRRGSGFHAQLFEVQVALNPTPDLVVDRAAVAQPEHRVAFGVDHCAADQSVLEQFLLCRVADAPIR